MKKIVRFAQPARKHKIGRAHALYVINLYDFQVDPDDFTRRSWVGVDSRGRELEITGIDLGDYLLVIHVMPTRRVKNYGKEGESEAHLHIGWFYQPRSREGSL